jgi:hypothetical protein
MTEEVTQAFGFLMMKQVGGIASFRAAQSSSENIFWLTSIHCGSTSCMAGTSQIIARYVMFVLNCALPTSWASDFGDLIST